MRSRWTRITLLLSTAITVAVVSATTANAATITGHDDETPMFQSWVDAAAPLVQLPNVPIEVIQERCPPEIAHDAYWCMDPESNPTRVWTGNNSAYLWGLADLYSECDRLTTRLTFLHEIGHVFDLACPGSKGYRRAFVRAMGRRWTGWWSRYEQFAMAYAFCAMYPHYHDAAFARTVWWGYGYNPNRGSTSGSASRSVTRRSTTDADASRGPSFRRPPSRGLRGTGRDGFRAAPIRRSHQRRADAYRHLLAAFEGPGRRVVGSSGRRVSTLSDRLPRVDTRCGQSVGSLGRCRGARPPDSDVGSVGWAGPVRAPGPIGSEEWPWRGSIRAHVAVQRRSHASNAARSRGEHRDGRRFEHLGDWRVRAVAGRIGGRCRSGEEPELRPRMRPEARGQMLPRVI